MKLQSSRSFLIVGLGLSGKAALAYAAELQSPIVVVDDATSVAQAYVSSQYPALPVRVVSSFDCMKELDLEHFSDRVISPGIAPHHPIVQECARRGLACTSEIELGLQQLGHRRGAAHPHIIGVTGTNGKTTTVELITHLLNQLGLSAIACGNIGQPLLDVLRQKMLADAYVIELSSYQIERISTAAFTHCAWLNIAPDHLEWHSSFEEYKAAKERLLSLLNGETTPVALLSKSLGSVTVPSFVRPYWYAASDAVALPESLVAQHDIENYVAASTIVHQCGFDYKEIAQAFASFKKGPHRIEHVATLECNGGEKVIFYDDSKGTNIHATLAAVAAIAQSSGSPIVLIAGGVHKGHPYTEWRESFPGHVIAVVTLGQAAEIICRDLSPLVCTVRTTTLAEAVERAFCIAKEAALMHDCVSVLLSPGCSSFDMFQNYQDRGLQFKRCVQQVVEAEGGSLPL